MFIEMLPGDTLLLFASAEDPKVCLRLTHAQLIESMGPKTKTSRKSKTPGAAFSRVVSLCTRALKSGKWATGATIDPVKVLETLVYNFVKLSTTDYMDVTPAARAALAQASDSLVCKDILEKINNTHQTLPPK